MALTKADKMVISMLLCVTACSPVSDIPVSTSELTARMEGEKTDTLVTISFAPPFDMAPMTRAAISEAASRLDVWVYDDDTEVAAVHQSSSSVDFGSVSLSLNKLKTYTLYAIAHKATDACTLTDGIIAWPDDKPKESFFYSTTFSPATTTSINAEMNRICGKFTLLTTDAVPDEVDHFRFVIADTGIRYNAVTGEPDDLTDRVVDFASVSRKNDGTCSLAFQILSTSDDVTNFTITATAYNASNEVVEQKTFNDVPIRNNYRTTLTGCFFTTEGMTMTFTASDWQDFDEINF